MDGSSLHSCYSFVPQRVVNSRLSIGALSRVSAELLQRGSVRPIIPGPKGAHALFHLERPSTSLVVRTHSDQRAQPQFEYHWPFYAMDPFFTNEVLTRKCQLLTLAHQYDAAALPRIAAEYLQHQDFESVIRILLYMQRLNLDRPIMTDMAATVARRFGELGTGLEALVTSGHRDYFLYQLRQLVRDPERRLLLAFLLNRLTASEIMGIVASKYDSQTPQDLVSHWICALVGQLLGIEPTGLFVSAVSNLLQENDFHLAQVKTATEFGRSTASDLDSIGKLLHILAGSEFFKPMFAAMLPAA
jgi:hypothetical protein